MIGREYSRADLFSEILGVVDVAHVAAAVELVVECQGGFETVGCLARTSDLEVFAQQVAVHRVSGVFDDLVGALYGVFSAEVGDTLIGDDDVD